MPYLNPICSSRSPSQISSDDKDAVERHVVLLYQRTSGLSHVNVARKRMFAFGNRIIENIPPALHALEQHVKRAVYQAGHVWGQSLSGEPQVPSPDLWGWERVSDDSHWTPLNLRPDSRSLVSWWACLKLQWIWTCTHTHR